MPAVTSRPVGFWTREIGHGEHQAHHPSIAGRLVAYVSGPRPMTVQTWPRPTLLGKSCQPISNATGIRVTRGMDSISLSFKHSMQDRFPCVCDLPNRVKASFTPVGNSADSRRLAQCRDPLYCNI